ncbi:DUF2975 domain-containing protein [Enterococcus pallens]|uniref:DUF2975 domain-containing protein n=1 Tax=Enterococcus pallens ATCC BAA-351 TaxID=1158607 RepID=R2Q8Y4_9ENTE|nr:DUF2975 domain-containing protein [Enterococcus pallens]EOH91728.1 hypothetical protein UAU_03030 [Enterococcus pallens ATCC BAA-351]EOU25156.1 hypothetical protein I588_01144 [Enterococcus pallens ATCC BAA-351]
MNAEKNVYKGLKIIFSLAIGLMVIAAVAVLGMAFVLHTSQAQSFIQSIFDGDLIYGAKTPMLFASPLIIGSLMILFILNGILFYFTRSFFKNLEMDRIFVSENVTTAKKVAALLLILSFASSLPDVMAQLQGFSTGGFSLDLTYMVGAAIVWALAKILERANLIAEENKLTI